MPITFGSVGDVISLCEAIHKLISALDDAKGSAREYADIVAELKSLERVLLEIQRLADDQSNVSELRPLFQAASGGASQCKRDMDRFLETISTYGRRFEHQGSGKILKSTFAKVKWQTVQHDELIKFRAHIGAHISSLNMLLSALNINIALASGKQMTDSFDQIRHTSNNVVAGQRTMLQSIRTWSQCCETFFMDAARNLKSAAQDILQGLEWLRNSTQELKETVRHIFALNFYMYAAVLSIQSSLSNHVERSPSLVSQAPWWLVDCVGRTSPVHTEFVISWGAFQSVLEVRFQGLAGFNKIRRREYVLQDVDSGDFIPRDANWETTFVPGKRYSMSVLFDEREELEDENLSSCPNCHYICSSLTDIEIQCAKCGIFFQRIVEEPTGSQSEDEDVARSRRKIGPKVKRGIKRRKYRPWFAGKKTSAPTTIQNPANERKTKRCWHDFESSESEPDHASFKRIRLVTPKTYTKTGSKRKRLRAFGFKNNSDFCNDSPGSVLTTSDILDPYESETETPPPEMYEYEDYCGRTYHATLTLVHLENAYLRPNDVREIDTEDILHHILELLLGSLHLAPLENESGKILDIGTGAGMWVIDMGDKYGEASVRGTDLSAIQPSLAPPNVEFVIDDFSWCGDRHSWDHKSQYSFIHWRNLCTAIRD